jgi:hypothetical protein
VLQSRSDRGDFVYAVSLNKPGARGDVLMRFVFAVCLTNTAILGWKQRSYERNTAALIVIQRKLTWVSLDRTTPTGIAALQAANRSAG